MKKIWNSILLSGEKILAICALFCARQSVQSACAMPFFEPMQPEELKKLKKY